MCINSGVGVIVYIYDIKFKTKKEFNKQKRRFYYNLKKLTAASGSGINTTNNINSKWVWLNKSVIAVQDKDEGLFDNFFSTYKKTNKDFIVYKFFTHSIEELD